MMEKKVLTLSVKKEWFSRILSGEKTEEYREIKDYWKSRLFYETKEEIDGVFTTVKRFVPFTHVLFINGYGDDRPRVEKEIESISIGKPKKGWCPDEFLDKDYFVIKFK